jgi:hypothetical protein
LPCIDGLNVLSYFASFNTLDLHNNNFVPEALIWLNASSYKKNGYKDHYLPGSDGIVVQKKFTYVPEEGSLFTG